MDNLRAIALMCAAMACFAVEDLVIKILAQTLPVWQIFWLLGGVGLVLFGAICRRRGLPLFGPDFLHPLVILRNLGDIVGSCGFVTALALVPLSLATAILQATPLALTAGAALFLGERVGWRRWAAVVLGLCGILIILDPTGADFRPEALFAVLGVVGLMMRDLATRRIPGRIPSHQLSFWGYCAFFVSGALLVPFDPRLVAPDATTLIAVAFGALVGAFGYWGLTAAMRLGEVSAVIPFRYTRLIFAMGLGIIVLGESPSMRTLLGAALVVVTGIYTVLRERRDARVAGC
ncbi:DMT family transporter [Maribius pontilimi]|uniref:DMT family transporter n=1 Tax=Palleronia pontilimi TaxID=1964209 RepID=A0A934IG59_9RHOB|nr:DMT family transporter [Palleronia pontilimi]MBJ3761975.1 DMT family transporter [Palleronia pontilimi]